MRGVFDGREAVAYFMSCHRERKIIERNGLRIFTMGTENDGWKNWISSERRCYRRMCANRLDNSIILRVMTRYEPGKINGFRLFNESRSSFPRRRRRAQNTSKTGCRRGEGGECKRATIVRISVARRFFFRHVRHPSTVSRAVVSFSPICNADLSRRNLANPRIPRILACFACQNFPVCYLPKRVPGVLSPPPVDPSPFNPFDTSRSKCARTRVVGSLSRNGETHRADRILPSIFRTVRLCPEKGF